MLLLTHKFLITQTQMCMYIDIYMSQAQKWVRKRNDDISYFRYKWLIGVDAGGYADDCRQFVCTCTVVFPPK